VHAKAVAAVLHSYIHLQLGLFPSEVGYQDREHQDYQKWSSGGGRDCVVGPPVRFTVNDRWHDGNSGGDGLLIQPRAWHGWI